MTHPQIVDAAIIGFKPVPNSDDELPCAYVVHRPGVEGAKLSESEVKAYMASRLAKYKRLEGGVVFIASIPKTASGKILKKDLRAAWQKSMGPKV